MSFATLFTSRLDFVSFKQGLCVPRSEDYTLASILKLVCIAKYGAVLDGKKDSSKKDRTTNADRIYCLRWSFCLF